MSEHPFVNSECPRCGERRPLVSNALLAVCTTCGFQVFIAPGLRVSGAPECWPGSYLGKDARIRWNRDCAWQFVWIHPLHEQDHWRTEAISDFGRVLISDFDDLGRPVNPRTVRVGHLGQGWIGGTEVELLGHPERFRVCQ